MTNPSNHSSTPSIRARLIFFYTAAVFVLLSIVAIFLYWATISLLYKADYEFLKDEIDTVHYLLESKTLNLAALKEAIVEAPQADNQSMYQYYIRLNDQNEKIMLETPKFSAVVEPGLKLKKPTAQVKKIRYYWYENNDRSYLLAQSPVKIGSDDKTGVVQVILDISYQHDIIHDKRKLISILFIGTLISLLFGFIITNRGLRSLYLLTKTVQKITATSLDQRIDPKSWPVELTGIGLAFNQMLERIESSFVRLKQFSADLSHEMRTPITNLIGQTEVTISYAKDKAEYRRVMESNLEELNALSSLIDNILFLARAENPKLEIIKSHLNVRDEIQLIIDYHQPFVDEKNIQVTYEGSAEINANVDMFRRMISNLLSNSLKYTPPNGLIKFNIRNVDKRNIEIVLTDTGAGISVEDLPKIFDRFYRADQARSPSPQTGTGLGLSIVKSVVDSHHGTIAICSELQVGTTITIGLPV